MINFKDNPNLKSQILGKKFKAPVPHDYSELMLFIFNQYLRMDEQKRQNDSHGVGQGRLAPFFFEQLG